MDFSKLNEYLKENNLVVVSYESIQIMNDYKNDLRKHKAFHRNATFRQRLKYLLTGEMA